MAAMAWILLLGAGAALAASQPSNLSAKNCDHGHPVPAENGQPQCVCDEGWRTAGPTDTIHFLEGTCDQYMCRSDEVCDNLLGFKNGTAQCMVPGWNCYCGWKIGFSHPRGFQTKKAKCMGILYTFSVGGGLIVWWLMCKLWMPFVVVAVLCLCFGQTHVRCQHHFPDRLRVLHAFGLLHVVGWRYRCNGQCENHRWWYNEFAWTIYVLDVMVWIYVFLLVAYVMLQVMEWVILWLAVGIMIICAGLFFCVAAICAGGDGDCDVGDCNTCGDAHALDCSMCDCAGGTPDPMLWMYNWDTFFYGPDLNFATGAASEEGCCHSILRRYFAPLAWLVRKFPAMPSNMWGGLFGRCLGTHPSRPHGRCARRFIERLDFRREVDLRNVRGWRERVAELISPPAPPAQAPRRSATLAPGPTQIAMAPVHLPSQRQLPANFQLPGLHYRTPVDLGRPLNMEEDRIVQASFDDYHKGECWICCGPEIGYWHAWTCGHVFCAKCSEKMLGYRMPCPLCRRVTGRVRKATKYTPPEIPE